MAGVDLIDRFEGTLVGLAVGDALGAPVEFGPGGGFMNAQEIASRYGTISEMIGGGELKLKPGEYTDDTNMMLCIAESLVENKGYNPDDIAQRFVRWYQTNPPDMGHTTRAALRKITKGISWKEAGDKNRPSNGSLMRCAPIGLFFAFGDEGILTRASMETSIITHSHRDAVLSCVVLNSMISQLVQGAEKWSAFRYAAEKAVRNDGFFENLILASSGKTNPASGLAVDTLILAVNSFTAAKTFEEAVINAVNSGGDTDTIGAVAGAIAGAHWGTKAIPERWSSKLNPYSAEKIKEMARVLFALSPKERRNCAERS